MHCWSAANDAMVATSATFAAIAHSPLPVQAPLQPEKAISLAGSGLSKTATSGENEAEHFPGQEMPAGAEVTVPEPETVTAIMRCAGGGGGGGGGGGFNAKFAHTVTSPLGDSVQAVLPLHPSPKPTNVDPGSSLAVM